MAERVLLFRGRRSGMAGGLAVGRPQRPAVASVHIGRGMRLSVRDDRVHRAEQSE